MGEMHKTSKSYCKKCKYHGNIHMGCMTCDYYLVTKKRRDCEVGQCDKFEKGKPDRTPLSIKILSQSMKEAYYGKY